MSVFLQILAETRNVEQQHPIYAQRDAMSFEVLTMHEAAERAGISRRQLNYRLAAGDGPVVTMIGHSKRIRSDLLEQWLQRCTINPTASPNSQAVAA